MEEQYYRIPETTFLRDDEIREFVNELREIYLIHGQTGHLREVISRVVKKHTDRVRVQTAKGQYVKLVQPTNKVIHND